MMTMNRLSTLLLAGAFMLGAGAPLLCAAQGAGDGSPMLLAKKHERKKSKKKEKKEKKAKKIKVIGYLSKIEWSKDKKEAVATLIVKKKPIEIVVQDEITLEKFRIEKIKLEDEIRVFYRVIEGRNIAAIFRRTAGCG